MSEIGDFISSIFGGGGSTGGGKAVPSTGGADYFSSLLPSIISAGTQLAGTYFTLDQNKQTNQMTIDQAEAQRKHELELAAMAKGGGGGGGGSQKMAALAALYNNYAGLTQKGATDLAQTAQATGRMGQDPLIARASVLR